MKRTILLACLIFGAAGLSASPVTLHLVSFNGTWQNGYPYTIQINGTQTLWAMCDDYNHDGTPEHNGSGGDYWQANLTNLGTGDLTNLRFASFGLTAYQEVGWILLQTEVTLPVRWPEMNYAVWHIFYPSLQIDQPAQDWVNAAITASQNGFYGADFTKVEIGTPIDINAPSTGDQEFIWITPEPGSLLLLGTGALGLAGVLRRSWMH